MTSKSKNTTWFRVAELLGIQLTIAPGTRAKCAYCPEGILRLYSDTVFGGKRFACTRCRRVGDLLDLIATIDGSDRDSALKKLANVSPDLHFTYTTNLENRNRLQAGQRLLRNIWEAGTLLTRGSNSITFQRILVNRGLRFEHTSDWHAENMDRQYRIITSDKIESTIACFGDSVLSKSALKQYSCPDGVYVMAGLYTLPGQLSGLIFFTTGKNNQHFELVWTIGPPAEVDAGLFIHPDHLATEEPLIVVCDPGATFKSSFAHAIRSSGLNPVASILDQKDLKTSSLQPLLNRPILLWCSQLSPAILRVAVRLNARISHYGFVRGNLRSENLDMIDWHFPFRALNKHSITWEEALFKMHRAGSSPTDMVELLRESDLDRSTIERIAEMWDPAQRSLFIDMLSQPSRTSVVSTDLGCVEQRSNGWVHMRKGREVQVCNKPWRVVNVIFAQHAEPQYELEILEGDVWHRISVDSRQLAEKPWQVLGHACEALHLAPFSGDPKWQSRAFHIAAQLHPAIKSVRPKALGLDHEVVRTCRVEISLRDGRLEPVGNGTSMLLLPLAGRELPSIAAYHAVVSHVPSYRVVTALVNQLTRHFLGLPELAVIGSGQYAQQMSQILSDGGFLDRSSLPVFRFYSMSECLSLKQWSRMLAPEQAVWANGTSNLAYWLAGVRSTIYLGPNCSASPVVSDRQMQALILHLLSFALPNVVAGSLPDAAVHAAWGSLAKSLRLESLSKLPRVDLLNSADACGYWISRALNAGVLSVSLSKPRAIGKLSIWLDGADQFRIHQAATNHILDKFGASPWDLTTLSGELQKNLHFCGETRSGRSAIWRFSLGILSESASQVLKNQGRVSLVPDLPESPCTTDFPSGVTVES